MTTPLHSDVAQSANLEYAALLAYYAETRREAEVLARKEIQEELQKQGVSNWEYVLRRIPRHRSSDK